MPNGRCVVKGAPPRRAQSIGFGRTVDRSHCHAAGRISSCVQKVRCAPVHRRHQNQTRWRSTEAKRPPVARAGAVSKERPPLEGGNHREARFPKRNPSEERPPIPMSHPSDLPTSGITRTIRNRAGQANWNCASEKPSRSNQSPPHGDDNHANKPKPEDCSPAKPRAIPARCHSLPHAATPERDRRRSCRTAG